MKLVYTYALGAYAERRGGSSPLCGTNLLHYFMIIFIIFLFNLIKTPPVFAQTATPSAIPSATPTPDLVKQYTSDYLYNYDLYQQALSNYQEKSQIYTKYGSITTEKDKLDATKIALISRNNTLKTYLTALRTSLNLYKLNDPVTNQTIQIELNKWESWLEEQNQIVSVYNNQADFTNWAKIFSSKWVEIQTIIYKSLVQQQINTQKQSMVLVLDLANEIKTSTSGQQDSQTWFNNFPVTQDLINTNLQSAYQRTQTKQYSNRFTNFYSNSQNDLNRSKNYIYQLVNDLKSISIKFSPTQNDTQ